MVEYNYIYKIMIELEKYPSLFHKYLLNITKFDNDMNYQIISNSNSNMKENFCHLHVYDLSKFSGYFSKYINKINKYFTVIITYSKGSNSYNSSMIYLKVQNRGYDVGGKICAIDYLSTMGLNYKYMMFLHSKTNKYKREKYFNNLLGQLDEIINKIESNDNILGVFPNTLWINHNGIKNYKSYDVYKNNERYLGDLLNFLGCKNRIKVFAEGNCMILQKKVIDFIFKEKCSILYNTLNLDNSFDYNWFIINYKYKVPIDNLSSIRNMYSEYTNKCLFGNNNELMGSGSSHPDGMIEHVFERIWINIVLELGGECLLSDIRGISTLNKLIEV